MGKYVLRCLECNREIKDEYTNTCSNHNSLLRTEYKTKKLNVKDLPGMWRFIDWLPAENFFDIDTTPITFKSEALGKELGLSNLYISFSGYWPERKAFIKTCSFKELEAVPTFQRANEKSKKTLVVASAGNTSRGFAHVSSITGTPVITAVPKSYLHRMWAIQEAKSVCLISVKGDYSDAIKVGEGIAGLEGMILEGGVKNVARRDGIGVALLDSVLSMGGLPDHYFQAIGSGVGAVATFEASKRIIADGRFGNKLPKLHLSQNLPFAPIFRAWKAGRKEIIPKSDMPNAKGAIKKIYANILSNRAPPYSIKGGVYDVLSATKGDMYGVTNGEAKEAEKLFGEIEGIDLDPAASVGIASLIQAIRGGAIGKDDRILLNVTGGGYERIKEDFSVHTIDPYFSVDLDTPLDEINEQLEGWWKNVRARE